MDEKKLKEFVQWCARNSQQESRFLYSNPGVNLPYFGVLDQVVVILGAERRDVSVWADVAVDDLIMAVKIK